MFKIREKQLKRVLHSIKSLFVKTKINTTDLLYMPKINTLTTYPPLVKSTNLYFSNVQTNCLPQQEIQFSKKVKVHSDLHFFNEMDIIFNPTDITEISKNKFLKIVSNFYKKTGKPLDSVKVEAVFLNIPITNAKKISFNKGKILIKNNHFSLDTKKNTVLIYQTKESKKSKVVLLDD
jgi:hypothetical protein